MSDNLESFLDKFDDELFEILGKNPVLPVNEIKVILDNLTDFFGRKYAHAVVSAIHIRDGEERSKFIDTEMEKLLRLIVHEIKENHQMEYLHKIILGMMRNAKDD